MHRLYQLQNINGSCHYHHSRKWGVPAHAQEHRETLTESKTGSRGGRRQPENLGDKNWDLSSLSLNMWQWAFENWSKGTPPKEINK